MNEKTARLLRRYAEATDGNLNELKRQWNAMDQFERRDFRVQMQATVYQGIEGQEEGDLEDDVEDDGDA